MAYIWQTHLGPEIAFDPKYHENQRVDIVSFVNEPPGVVLDIGCGGGATGKLIKEKFPGTRVIGIELNPLAAEHARQYLDDVICANIDTVILSDHVGAVRIDTVLLLDVLEHLYDPWRALTRIRGWLGAETRVLASVPNIRNLANLEMLAGGRWDYTDNGVLDITHLRFFTKDSLRELFEQTGYVVRHMEPLTQPRLVDRHVIGRQPGQLQTPHVTIRYRTFDDLEDLYAFQYVVDACPASAEARVNGLR